MTEIAEPSVAPGCSPELAAGYAYSLEDLQAVARDQYGMTAAQTLEAAMELFARGLITYPRVGERRLSETVFKEASSIVRAYQLASGNRRYNSNYRAPCWSDEVSLGAQGIMLTAAPAGALFGVPLPDAETRLYRLVHARFLSLFVPPKD